MDEENVVFSPRLDQISTRWSLVRRAHADSNQSAETARRALVLRYSTSIRDYVGALCRNDSDADEIAQDVLVRILSGKFGSADENRGRFRDLLKVSVKNMVRNFWSRNQRRKGAALDVDPEDSSAEYEHDPWLAAWRRNLLDLTWSALEDYQRKHPGSVACTLLRLRTENPDLNSDDLAARLSERVGRPFRADAIRQQIRRARIRFAEYLVEEIADGLDHPDPERVEDELVALGLIEQVREFVPAGWGRRSNRVKPSRQAGSD